MKAAVISDVHANVEALAAILGGVHGMDVYCLGDLVDYGAEPNEAIQMLKSRGARCIMGNHDSAATSGDTSNFDARAAMSSALTRRVLSGASLEFLKALPLEMKPSFGNVRAYFVHGSPDDRLWEYVDPRTHANLFGHYLDRAGVRLIGMGHTHVPYVWEEEGRVVFNPGSVGQPRDGDWRASFAALSVEGERIEVEIRRVEYDNERAASKIRDAGLPGAFAERLVTGD